MLVDKGGFKPSMVIVIAQFYLLIHKMSKERITSYIYFFKKNGTDNTSRDET